MLLRRLSAACRWLDVSGTTDCNGKEHQAGRECFEHGRLHSLRSVGLRGFLTLCRWATWYPELEPAHVAEFPQTAHKAREPDTEQFTARTLRSAPDDSESFIALLFPAERRQARTPLLSSRHGAIASGYGHWSARGRRRKYKRLIFDVLDRQIF